MKLVQRLFGSKQEESDIKTEISSVFGEYTITEEMRGALHRLLEKYAEPKSDIASDLQTLSRLTAEVKTLDSHAALLHGERIRQVQDLLKRYRDGAFTCWLVEAYGNRQTPYNFLQYHEFHKAVPKKLHAQLEAMPRQAIYTLASRKASLKEKQTFIEKCSGKTKDELLLEIRSFFPLKQSDKRKPNFAKASLKLLEQAHTSIKLSHPDFSADQKKRAASLIKGITDSISS